MEKNELHAPRRAVAPTAEAFCSNMRAAGTNKAANTAVLLLLLFQIVSSVLLSYVSMCNRKARRSVSNLFAIGRHVVGETRWEDA